MQCNLDIGVYILKQISCIGAFRYCREQKVCWRMYRHTQGVLEFWIVGEMCILSTLAAYVCAVIMNWMRGRTV